MRCIWKSLFALRVRGPGQLRSSGADEARIHFLKVRINLLKDTWAGWMMANTEFNFGTPVSLSKIALVSCSVAVHFHKSLLKSSFKKKINKENGQRLPCNVLFSTHYAAPWDSQANHPPECVYIDFCCERKPTSIFYVCKIDKHTVWVQFQL